MNKLEKKLKIAIVSFDWRNIFENDFSQVVWKLKRDHLNPELNNFFFLSWSNKSYFREKGNIKTTHLKAFFGWRIFGDLFSLFALPSVLLKRKFKPDIVMVFDFPLIFSGLFVKLFWGSQIVLFLSNLPTGLADTRQLSFFRKIYQSLCEFLGRGLVDKYICISESTKNYLLGLGINPRIVSQFWPDTISAEKVLVEATQEGIIRKELGISQDKKIILSVGRLEPEKGFNDLINYFSKLKRDDVFLIIVGEGRLKQELINLARARGLADRIFFAGQVSRDKIWQYYRNADVFVLLSRSEGLGMVFFEAMYAGLPVIGRKIDAITQTIGENDERGYLWDTASKEDGFLEKLNLALDNPDQEKIKKARLFVEEKMGYQENINSLI